MERSRALELRPALDADYDAFLRLFPQLGTDDPIRTRDRFAREMRATTLVAEHEGRVVGYSFYELLAGVGYVRHVVVDAECRGLGVGRALMLGVRDRLRAAGCWEWCLNVRPDNLPALRLYESLGLTAVYDSVALRFTWSAVEHLPLGPALELAIDPEPAVDAEVESAFGLVPGLLAGARARVGRVIAVARQGERMAGVAVFDSGFPGAFPFRVLDAANARRLLEGLKPFARPGVPEMGVVVENDAALEAMLFAVGAVVRFRVVHHRGALEGGPPRGGEPPGTHADATPGELLSASFTGRPRRGRWS
ncbi:Acetyltransferase, GNAT family protein [Minicystis rosea]|nr:Acetyltransferase, GNAT family protein [Minicystis rosea]